MKKEQLMKDLLKARECSEDCGNCPYKAAKFCRTERTADFLIKKYFDTSSNSKSLNVILQMLKKYGEDSQIEVAIEEMSELTKELIKYMRSKIHEKEKTADRRDKVVEELGDVMFMLQYLLTIFNVKEKELLKIINSKVERTAQRYL